MKCMAKLYFLDIYEDAITTNSSTTTLLTKSSLDLLDYTAYDEIVQQQAGFKLCN